MSAVSTKPEEFNAEIVNDVLKTAQSDITPTGGGESHPIGRDELMFSYEPLPNTTSIRLVRIDPEIGPGDLIALTMRTVDLNDAPTYVTL
jgi:hypothetical protein